MDKPTKPLAVMVLNEHTTDARRAEHYWMMLDYYIELDKWNIAERDALATELAQYQTSNHELMMIADQSARRVQALEAALREIEALSHSEGNGFWGALYRCGGIARRELEPAQSTPAPACVCVGGRMGWPHDEDCHLYSASETDSKHSTEDDYRHFLSYSGLPNTAELQLAYYAGAGKTMEDTPAPPAKLTQKQIADSIQRKFENSLKPIASAAEPGAEQ